MGDKIPGTDIRTRDKKTAKVGRNKPLKRENTEKKSTQMVYQTGRNHNRRWETTILGMDGKDRIPNTHGQNQQGQKHQKHQLDSKPERRKTINRKKEKNSGRRSNHS